MEDNKDIKSQYCLKCKKVCELKNVEVKKSKNNRNYQVGNCIDCDVKSCRFLKNEKSQIAKKMETLLENNDQKKE